MKNFMFIMWLITGFITFASLMLIIPLLICGLNVDGELKVLVIAAATFGFIYINRKRFD
jgi:hypothetical protein